MSHSKEHLESVISFIKNWTLPIAMLSGIVAYFLYVNIHLFDSTHSIVARAIDVIQPMLIFLMLFLTFLNIGPRDIHFRKWHLWHILIQVSVFALLTFVLTWIGETHWRIIIESAMLCLLCPTATAAAVVTRKLDGNPADITTYTILINLAMAITAPALLPIAHPIEGLSFFPTFLIILRKVLPILIFPLIIAWCFRKWLPVLTIKMTRNKDIPFYLWAFALSLAIAVTVKAIMHSQVPFIFLIGIGLITLISCLLQFYIGKKIGSIYGEKIEGGQALGQKNTVFIIWLGYTFLSPASAMAGGVYSLWHNIYNSYQLYKHGKK